VNTAPIAICAVILLVLLAAPVLRINRRNRLARTLARRHGSTSRFGSSGLAAVRSRVAGRLAVQRQARAQPAQALAAMLNDVARRCSSGCSLTASFLAANSTETPDSNQRGAGAEFRRTIAALRGGAIFHDALGHETPRHADTALAIHVLRLCALQGGNVSESLDRAAATLRERHGARQERIAQAAQARLSAKVLTLVPVAFAGWTMLTTESVRQFLTTPIGAGCLATGIILNLAGWWLMKRAIRATA